MRDFQPLYNNSTGKWSIIARDPGDEYWWTYISDVGGAGQGAANETAAALRRAQHGEA